MQSLCPVSPLFYKQAESSGGNETLCKTKGNWEQSQEITEYKVCRTLRYLGMYLAQQFFVLSSNEITENSLRVCLVFKGAMKNEGTCSIVALPYQQVLQNHHTLQVLVLITYTALVTH